MPDRGHGSQLRVRPVEPRELGRVCQHDGCEALAARAARAVMVRGGSQFAIWRLWCERHVPGA